MKQFIERKEVPNGIHNYTQKFKIDKGKSINGRCRGDLEVGQSK